MSFLLQCLMTVFIFILSVPLHEFCHLLAYKLVGSTTKFEVKWLSFNRRLRFGYVRPADGGQQIHIPDFWGRYFKVPAFFALLFGGCGTALALFGLTRLMLTSSHDFGLWRMPFLIVGAFHFLYSILESSRIRNIKLVE